jgi:predicted transcriptional regulator
MTEITVQLTDEQMERLRDEAQRLNMPLEAIINTAIEYFLDDDEPGETEILAGLRQAMMDVLDGNVLSAEDVLAELKQEFGYGDDES